MDVTSPVRSVAVTAELAGLRASYLRGLLKDGAFAFLAAPSAKSRAPRGSLIDAFRLRVLRHLLDRGFGEMDALFVIDCEVDTRVGALVAFGSPIEAAVLIPRLDGCIHVAPSEDDELPELFCSPSDVPAPSHLEAVVTLNLLRIWEGVVASLDAQTAGGRASADAPRRPRRAPVSGATLHDSAGIPAGENAL